MLQTKREDELNEERRMLYLSFFSIDNKFLCNKCKARPSSLLKLFFVITGLVHERRTKIIRVLTVEFREICRLEKSGSEAINQFFYFLFLF